jgi:hypothetical protein
LRPPGADQCQPPWTPARSGIGLITIALGALLVYENAAGARLLVS